MGCFYTGFDYKNRKNGYFKIGESGNKTPAVRLSQIRQNDSFQCLGYLLFENDTKAQRLFIESYTRMKMSERYEHTQNDHFLYTIRQGEMSRRMKWQERRCPMRKKRANLLM